MPTSPTSLFGRAAASMLTASLLSMPLARAETASPPAPSSAEAKAPVAESTASKDAVAPAEGTTPAPVAATPAPPAAPAEAKPAEPPPPPAPPENPKLKSAKDLMLKKKYDEALKALAEAAVFPENTPAMKTEITLTRMQVLLVKKKPDAAAAKAIALEFLHADPDGVVFVDATPEIRKVVADIRETQPLVVHEPVKVGRPNRPWKVRASLLDRTGKAAGLTLHYRPHGGPVYFQEPFKRESGSYAVLLKSPLAVAPSGVTEDFLVDYYISAVDAAGKVLDTNTLPEAPLTIQFSTAAAESADTAKGINLALVENPLPPPAPVTVVTAETKPWYLRWYTLTGAGVVVVGATAAIIYAATRTEPLPASNGELHIP